MNKLIFTLILFCFWTIQIIAQNNTVGLLSYNPAKAFDGYNLFYPHNQSKVFLVNNCGQIVNIWEDEDPDMRPGNTAYLLENGTLLKTKRLNIAVNDPLWAGGGGAIVENRDWNNNLIWSFELGNEQRRLHHDIRPMPNGNILMIAWEKKTKAQAIQGGRSPDKITQDQFWPDYVLELNPTTNDIVWEWHVWDHVIQDFDATKDNYGIVENHPELVDLNWDDSDNHPDWMHTNAIDYNPELDQILLSAPNFHEVWIIDHSTTKEEAAGHSGGLSGKGGDLLFRWGNPQTYRKGTSADQKLFFQHDANWADNFLDKSQPHYGDIEVFNNRFASNYSVATFINPTFDKEQWQYKKQGERWEPREPELTVKHPEPLKLYSNSMSSVQLLPNGNILICSGRWGYTFELTPDNEIVWEYKTPISGGSPVEQGRVLDIGTNVTFRLERYPADFPGFIGKDLSAKGYLELNPDLTLCERLTDVEDILKEKLLEVYPNPASNNLVISWQGAQNEILHIFNAIGQQVASFQIQAGANNLNLNHLQAGMYFLRAGNSEIKKMVLQR